LSPVIRACKINQETCQDEIAMSKSHRKTQPSRLPSFVLIIATAILVIATRLLAPQAAVTSTVSTYDLSQEQLEYEVEWQAPSGTTGKYNFDHYRSAISTFNGFTYAIWTDNDNRPRVAKIKDGEAQVEFLVKNPNYHQREDGHNKFSLGIDKDGYIHVAGDMHHFPKDNIDHLSEPYKSADCMYWVSEKPEDITKFVFLGKDQKRVIPGLGFSSYYFDTDNNGELYFVARQWARTDSHWTPGKISVGIARYNTQTKYWKALGGVAPVPNNDGNKVLFWEDNGVDGTAYQGLTTDIWFDKNNQLHFTASINNDNSYNASLPSSATHVVYAYSDDGGETWRKADGSQISSLPLRVSTANIAHQRHWFANETGVGVTEAGSPIVSWRNIDKGDKNKQSQWRIFNGEWLPIVDMPMTCRGAKAVVDKWNVITTFCGDDIRRMIGYDQEPKEYTVPASLHSVDRRWLRQTGQLRFVADISDNFAIVNLNITPPPTTETIRIRG
jgi:hypothetical protein